MENKDPKFNGAIHIPGASPFDVNEHHVGARPIIVATAGADLKEGQAVSVEDGVAMPIANKPSALNVAVGMRHDGTIVPLSTGPKSNPHADLNPQFSETEKEQFRRDFGEITRPDVQGLDDPIVRAMPATWAHEMTLFVEHRSQPPNFFRAMLEGNIEIAYQQTTYTEHTKLPILAYWIWRYAPREAIGSPEAVSAWIGGAR